jgi:hypothetical protein
MHPHPAVPLFRVFPLDENSSPYGWLLLPNRVAALGAIDAWWVAKATRKLRLLSCPCALLRLCDSSLASRGHRSVPQAKPLPESMRLLDSLVQLVFRTVTEVGRRIEGDKQRLLRVQISARSIPTGDSWSLPSAQCPYLFPETSPRRFCWRVLARPFLRAW